MVPIPHKAFHVPWHDLHQTTNKNNHHNHHHHHLYYRQVCCSSTPHVTHKWCSSHLLRLPHCFVKLSLHKYTTHVSSLQTVKNHKVALQINTSAAVKVTLQLLNQYRWNRVLTVLIESKTRQCSLINTWCKPCKHDKNYFQMCHVLHILIHSLRCMNCLMWHFRPFQINIKPIQTPLVMILLLLLLLRATVITMGVVKCCEIQHHHHLYSYHRLWKFLYAAHSTLSVMFYVLFESTKWESTNKMIIHSKHK